MDFHVQIQKHYGSLNDNEKQVIDFIRNHMEEAAGMSINELALRVSSSRSSISRLAQKIGYRGFSELKFALQHPQTNNQSIPSNLIEIFRQEVLDDFAMAEQSNFYPLLSKMKSCRRLVLLGTGAIQNLYNREFASDLMLCGRSSMVVESFHNCLIHAQNMNEEDLIIITSFSGESSELPPLINALKANHVSICSITEISSNFLSRNADFRLYTHIPALPINGCHSMVGLHLMHAILFRKYMEYVLYDE